MVYYRETGKKAKKLNGKSGKECAALGSTKKHHLYLTGRMFQEGFRDPRSWEGFTFLCCP